MDETNSVPHSTETTCNGSVPVPDSLDELSLEELQDALESYSRTKPLPDWREALPDLRWFEAHRYDEDIQAHRGDYVAIFDGKMIGAGNDNLKLHLDCSKKLGVHPARILVLWVDDGRDLHVTYPDDLMELPLVRR